MADNQLAVIIHHMANNITLLQRPRILGIFLDNDRRPSAREELIHRESVVSERVVAVLGYSNVAGGARSTIRAWSVGWPRSVETPLGCIAR